MFFINKEFPQFYQYKGRKISKKLSNLEKNLLDNFYDYYSIDQEIIEFHNNNNKKKQLTFTDKIFNKVNIEVGFGNGEYLIKSALENPNELFIGSEVYINGISKVLKKIINFKIRNIKLSNLNFIYLLESIYPQSINKVIIINPDPWLKKRHQKRRLLSFHTLKLLKTIIINKDSVFITTDSESYIKYIFNIFETNKSKIGKIQIKTLTNSDSLYGVSRYQRKAIKNGSKIYLLTI